jgi:hypothetical protein
LFFFWWIKLGLQVPAFLLKAEIEKNATLTVADTSKCNKV